MGAMTMTETQIGKMVVRVQSKFLDDPALCLTLRQAQKRFGFDPTTCAGVLGALVDARVLTHLEGTYRRYFPPPVAQNAA